MMQGAFFLACENTSRTREAPTPTNISTNSEPEIEMKGTPASPATALARRVLPEKRERDWMKDKSEDDTTNNKATVKISSPSLNCTTLTSTRRSIQNNSPRNPAPILR
eukprot:scaffold13280_cov69-Alexandrium_tamarense.AAC.1